MNYVIVCPDKYCRGVTIVSKKGKTTKCMSCDKQQNFTDYKLAYKSSDKKEAIKARTKLLTKINEGEKTFEEIENEGYLDDPEKTFRKKQTSDNRTPEEVIYDVYDDKENMTIEDLIERASQDSNMDHKKCEKVVNRMLEKGFAIKDQNREITLL